MIHSINDIDIPDIDKKIYIMECISCNKKTFHINTGQKMPTICGHNKYECLTCTSTRAGQIEEREVDILCVNLIKPGTKFKIICYSCGCKKRLHTYQGFKKITWIDDDYDKYTDKQFLFVCDRCGKQNCHLGLRWINIIKETE